MADYEEQIEHLGVNLTVTGSEKFADNIDDAAVAMDRFSESADRLSAAAPKFDAATAAIKLALGQMKTIARSLKISEAGLESFTEAMNALGASKGKFNFYSQAAAAADGAAKSTKKAADIAKTSTADIVDGVKEVTKTVKQAAKERDDILKAETKRIKEEAKAKAEVARAEAAKKRQDSTDERNRILQQEADRRTAAQQFKETEAKKRDELIKTTDATKKAAADAKAALKEMNAPDQNAHIKSWEREQLAAIKRVQRAAMAPVQDAHVKSYEKNLLSMQGMRSRLPATAPGRVDPGSAATIRAIKERLRLEEQAAQKIRDYEKDQRLATLRMQQAQKHAADAQIAIEKVLQDTVGKSASYRRMKLQEVAEATREVTQANIDGMKHNLAYRKSVDANNKAELNAVKTQQSQIAAIQDRLRKRAEADAAKARHVASTSNLGFLASKDAERKIQATLQAQLNTIDQMARATGQNFSEQALRDFRSFRSRMEAQARGVTASIQGSNFVGRQTDVLKDVNKGKQRLKVLNMSTEDRALANFEKRLRSSNTLVRTIAQSTLRWREMTAGVSTTAHGILGTVHGLYRAINLILAPIRLAASLLTGLFNLMRRNSDETEKSARAAERLASTQRKLPTGVQRPALARSQMEAAAPQPRRGLFGKGAAQTIKVTADTGQAEANISRVKRSVKEVTQTAPKVTVHADTSSTVASLDKVRTSTRQARNEVGQFTAEAHKLATGLSTIAPQAQNTTQQIIEIGVTARRTQGVVSQLLFTLAGAFATGFGIGLAQSLFRAAGQGILNTIQNIKNAIGGLISEGVASFQQVENMMVSLTSLMASEMVMGGQFKDVTAAQGEAAKGAEELYDWVAKLATLSPFGKSDILNVMQMGMGFGISSENMKALTQTTVDWASSTNKSAAEMEQLMRGLGQLSGAAVVTKEDLNQLREAGLPAATILAKMRGQTQGQFLQDVTDGTVKATDVITELTQFMNSQYQGAAERAGGTLTGLLSTLRDIKSERLGQLATPIMEGIVKPLLSMAVALAQSETASQFFTELGARVNAFGSLVMGVFYNATQLFTQFFGLIPDEVKTFAATFAQVGLAIAGVSLALSAVGIAFSVFGAVVGLVLSPIALLIAGITAFHLAYKNSMFGVREITDTVWNGIGAAFNAAIQWFADLYNNSSSYLNAWGQSVSDAVDWVMEVIWTLPTGFSDVMNAVWGYGQNIMNMFAQGILAAGTAVSNALSQIGAMIEYWLVPGSPPKLLPHLTKWGTGAADAYLEGWNKADFGVFTDMSGAIEAALASISEDALPMDQIIKVREAVAATIGNFAGTGSFDGSQIEAVSGPFAESMSRMAQLYLQTASSARIMADAQVRLDKTTEKYTRALAPLQERLKQIQGLQSGGDMAAEAKELERVLANTSATKAQKDAAKLKLEELKIQQEINAVEGQQSAETQRLQEEIAAAGKINALSQEELDIMKERWAVQQNIQDGVQANVRAAIAQSNAQAAQVEKDVVGKSDAEAEKIRREAEKNAEAQLALNMQMADTPGKIALLKDKLAGLTEGSTEYLNVQKQIVALEQKNESEIEAEAKRLEREGKSAEAAALREQKAADKAAKDAAKLAPGGTLALGGGTSLPMPKPIDLSGMTAKFKEAGDGIKESFSGVTESLTPVTEKLTKIKGVVDEVVKAFKDGFGGKEGAGTGFAGVVEDIGAKAKALDGHLKTAATSITKFSTDFKSAFDVADGTVAEKIGKALDATGVTAKVASFRSSVLGAIGGGGETGGKGEEAQAGGFGQAFANAFRVAPGSITAKIADGLDAAGVGEKITTFKDLVIKKMDELASSAIGAQIKAKVEIVMAALTVTNITEKLNELKKNLVDGLGKITFQNEDLQAMKNRLVEALGKVNITEGNVSSIGLNIVKAIALFFAARPLIQIGSGIVSGIVAGLGGAGITWAGVGGAITAGIGAILASPFLWVPIGGVIVGAVLKSVSGAIAGSLKGDTAGEKVTSLMEKLDDITVAAREWVTGMAGKLISALQDTDWTTVSAAGGFTVGAAISKFAIALIDGLLNLPWASLISGSLSFVGNVAAGLVTGLAVGIIYGIYDSLAKDGGSIIVGALKTIFGAIVGLATGLINTITGLINAVTTMVNAKFPEFMQVGQIPKLIIESDMTITTDAAIAQAKADLENAQLQAEIKADFSKAQAGIAQQIQQSGIGESIAITLSEQLGTEVSGTDFSAMFEAMKLKLGRDLTGQEMVNLDVLLDEVDLEMQRVALQISQASNKSEIVQAINDKLNTDFASTDFSAAADALVSSLNGGWGPEVAEDLAINDVLKQAGINLVATAEKVGSDAAAAVKSGMSVATAEKHASRDDIGGGGGKGGMFGSLVTDAEAAGAQIPVLLSQGIAAGQEQVVTDATAMATQVAAGVDAGLEAQAETTGTTYWERVKKQWAGIWSIQSPSQVAHDEYGVPIGGGVLLGIMTALAAVPDPLAALKLTMSTAMTLIVANTKTFGVQMKAQFMALKVSTLQVSTEMSNLMKNLYLLLYRDLLNKTSTYRAAIVKETAQLRDEVVAIYEAMSDAIKEIMDALYEYIVGIFEDIKNDSLDQLEGLKDDAVELIAAMNAAIEAELGKLPGIFETELGKVIDVINSDTIKTQFVTAGEGLGISFLEAVAEGLADASAMTDINNAVQDVVDAVETALQDALDALADATQQAATQATTTETEQPIGNRSNFVDDIINRAQQQNQDLYNTVVNGTTDVVAAGGTGGSREVVLPVTNTRNYTLNMQVTPSQVERVTTNYEIFEALTG